MNDFLALTKRSIDRQGKLMQYLVVSEGQYDVETGSTTNTETSYSVKMYKKHIRANQYNYPNLIGRDSALFYLANNNLTFTPAMRDKIIVDSVTYQIDSVTEHSANGLVILYKIIAVKG